MHSPYGVSAFNDLPDALLFTVLERIGAIGGDPLSLAGV